MVDSVARLSTLNVHEEVHEMRQELSQIRNLLASNGGAVTGGAPLQIRVHVERSPGERKPFLLTFRSSSETKMRLSTTRTAITLTLLLDLDQRSHGLVGLGNVRETSLRVLQLISNEAEDYHRAREQVRVGLYRFSSFWRQGLQTFFGTAYDRNKEQIALSPHAPVFDIDIQSSDSKIEDALPSLGRSTILDRIRRDKFLFVPAGGSGGESFLSEVYSSPSPLKVILAYARPQLISCPPALIQKYNSSPGAVTRHASMHERLSRQSLEFTEYVPEDSVERWVSKSTEGGLTYFPGMSPDEVSDHLLFLENLVLARNGYRLVLTRAEIPFYVGTYETESYNLASFFRVSQETESTSFSSFAVWGPEISRMVAASVFEWLRNHPTTTSDVEDVASIIRAARERLLS